MPDKSFKSRVFPCKNTVAVGSAVVEMSVCIDDCCPAGERESCHLLGLQRVPGGSPPALGPPEILEPRRRQLRVPDGVLNVLMAEISLQRPRVVPPVGQCVTAGVPKHVRVGLEGKFRLDPCPLHHAGEPGGAEGGSALRRKYEGRLGLLLALEPP